MISEQSIYDLFESIDKIKSKITEMKPFDHLVHTQRIEEAKAYNESLKHSSQVSDLTLQHQRMIEEIAHREEDLASAQSKNKESERSLQDLKDEIIQLELSKQILLKDHEEAVQELESLIHEQKLQNIERRNEMQKMALRNLIQKPRISAPKGRKKRTHS